MKKLLKVANCTDIHFGAHVNSIQHNEDCLKYIDWFCDIVKSDGTIDHVNFLGDWFQQRDSVNIYTMWMSHQAARKLNDLNLPIYFLLGNHDLFFRHNRSVYSTISFEELNNFKIIYKPTVVQETFVPSLYSPYLFHPEYPSLLQYNNIPIWWIHGEFKNFIITGDSIVLEYGPDPDDYDKATIFSGHFHKRQSSKNIHFIGNTFPTNFADANDFDRGMCIYDYKKDDMQFINYEGPSYLRTTLSKIIEDPSILKKDASVKCLTDQDITLEEASKLKERFIKKFELREFTFEEPSNQELLEDTNMDLSGLELETTDSIVESLLARIPQENKIHPDRLIEMYKRLHS